MHESSAPVAFRESLSGRILLFGILPLVLVVLVLLATITFRMLADARQGAESSLELRAGQVAAAIERANTRAAMAARVMAFAQLGGMFGQREVSVEYARQVLDAFPEFTGAYFGYEPDADQDDGAFRAAHGEGLLALSTDASGRFLPYWFRDLEDPATLQLEPLRDMDTSSYYQGVKQQFLASGETAVLITEPYEYYGKMIVEQVYPLVRDGEFVGIAGVDRALDDIVALLQRIKAEEDIDLYLVSGAGRFIAATSPERDELRTRAINETPYVALMSDFVEQGDAGMLELAEDPWDGETYYFVSAPVKTGGWTVMLRQSEESVLAPIRAAILPVAGMALGGFAMVALLAFWITSSAARRIRRTVDAADRLAAGDSSVGRHLDEGRDDEVGRLSHSFNRLVASHHDMTEVCKAIAEGDFSRRVTPRGPDDELAGAINEMAQKRYEAEDSLKLFRRSVEQGAGIVIITDTDGVISYVNQRFVDLTGYSREEAVGQRPSLLKSGIQSDELYAGLWSKLLAGEQWNGQLCNRRKDGSHVWVSASIFPIRAHDSGITHFVAVEEDITERRAVQEQFRSLVENIPGVTYRCALDADWTMHYVSDAVEELTGYPSGDFIENAARTYDSVIHPDDRAMVAEAVDAALQEGGAFTVEYRVRHRDGSVRWVRERGRPRADAGGNTGHIDGAIFDITDRRAVEDAVRRSEERFRAIYEHSVEPFVVLDSTGIIDCNRAAVRLLGFDDKDDLVGRRPYEFSPEFQPDGSRSSEAGPRSVQSVLRRGGGRMSWTFQSAGGEEIPVEVSVAPIPFDDRMVYIGVWHDLRDQKEVERELRKAKEAADTANRAKSAFLANMSHELRTPMNAIIGYSEMMMEELEDVEDGQYVDDLARIHASGRHLLSLINDILDLSKIEAGRMELFLERFDVKSMLEQVVATIGNILSRNENELVLELDDDLGDMRADLTKVRQVLFNLVSNAAKFTHHGRITLRARRIAGELGDSIEFDVADSGIGIHEDKLEHIFEEFSQADSSTTRSYGGTGLGLAITRRFCKLMRGDIRVTSELGVGSTFTVRLPARVSPLEAASSAAEAATETAKASAKKPMEPLEGADVALVIEDDPAARDLLERALQREGFFVLTAADGEAGLTIAEQVLPKVITLDVMMPGIDGWEVLRRIKSHPRLADIPVVMVTVVADENLGYALGASDYLTKPVDRARLENVLSQYKGTDGAQALVVDDEPDARDMLRRQLEGGG